MTHLLTAIAAGLLLTSTAATTARDGAAQKSAKIETSHTQTGVKYCISYDDLVGSRLTQKECKTREEWAKAGVDVDNPGGN
jgi:hypothetical protein